MGYFRWQTAVYIKSGVCEVQRAQNRLFQMVNSCLYEIRCLGVSKTSKSAILDGKQLFLSNRVFRRSRDLKIGYFRWQTAVYMKSGVLEFQRPQNRLFQMVNSCLYQIRCLGVSETPKSAILDGKKLFLSNQVFWRLRDPKIGYFKW